DPIHLEQAIVNLVLNARDALPAGGRIRLQVARVPRAQADLPPDAQPPVSDYVRLRVVDNGSGSPPEARAHLFGPVFTTKALRKGTGLGLASVYGIVKQSNGTIAVDSEQGRGTTFTMHFPAVAAPRATPDADRPPLDSAGGGETVLLVEDEHSVRQFT